ncbi:MAG: LysM peptidoglycan-binding domain-containing protein [Eubacteriales bacterium]|jgi:nucleoid-associated protein YgaU
MEYCVYLTEGARRYPLPVNPQNIRSSWESGARQTAVLGIGQVVLPGEETLEHFTFTVPLDNEWVSRLRRWRSQGTVLTMQAIGKQLYLQREVILYRMTQTQLAGREEECEVELEWMEYRGYRKAELLRKQWQEEGSLSAPVSSGATYTVVKGDCLWRIAQRMLGDGSRYGEIYQLNQDIITNPNLIYPGQVLRLPG